MNQLTVEDFLANYCYEGTELQIRGVGQDSEIYFEGSSYDADEVPSEIMSAPISFVSATEDVLIIECDTNTD